MRRPRTPRGKIAAAVTGAGVVAALLAGCSSGSSTGSSGNDLKNFTFLGINENTTIPAVLTALSKNECKSENTALPLKINKRARSTSSCSSSPARTPCPPRS
jgi:raffinose/stachyose/melibiose transport system substrate-binding protein